MSITNGQIPIEATAQTGLTNASLNLTNSSLSKSINSSSFIHNSNRNYSSIYEIVNRNNLSRLHQSQPANSLFDNSLLDVNSTDFNFIGYTSPFQLSSFSSIDNNRKTPQNEIDSTLILNLIIAILIFWNIYGFFIQIKLLFFTKIKASTNQFFDNCTINTSYFKYMIRLKFSDLIGGYQISNGTIMIDLFDLKDRFIARLSIPPNWFNHSNSNKFKNKVKQTKVVKFRLNRRYEFPEIGSIR